MAYSAPYTFTALELLTAAKMNAIQTNITALWPYTTTGDVSYASSASALARLGIGGAYKLLQVNAAGNAPTWDNLHFASVYRSSNQNLTNGSATLITFDNENADAPGWHDNSTNNSRVTVGVTGYYQMAFTGRYTGAGGTGTYWDTVNFLKSGTIVAQDRRLQNIDLFEKQFGVCSPILPVTAAQYLEVSIEQNSGGTRVLQAGTFSVLRIS
jgi:hypothetical protein